MARNKKINSFVWTSSYGSKWHKLPKYLKKYIKRRKILVKAVPGRKISQNVVNEVKEIAGKNQCHIFILGNNSPTIEQFFFHILFPNFLKVRIIFDGSMMFKKQNS